MKIIDNNECLIGFGEFIRTKREQLGIYQQDVASEVGISQVYYSHIERGLRNVDLVLALEICKILRLDLNEYIKAYLLITLFRSYGKFFKIE